MPDFQVGRTTCILFLRYTSSVLYTWWCSNQHVSLRYHRLHPEYIHTRIEKLGHSFNLRILLIMCDVVSRLRMAFCLSLTSDSDRAPGTDQGADQSNVLSLSYDLLSTSATGVSYQQSHRYRRVEVRPFPAQSFVLSPPPKAMRKLVTTLRHSSNSSTSHQTSSRSASTRIMVPSYALRLQASTKSTRPTSKRSARPLVYVRCRVPSSTSHVPRTELCGYQQGVLREIAKVARVRPGQSEKDKGRVREAIPQSVHECSLLPRQPSLSCTSS